MATTKIGPDGGKATRGARVLTRTKTVAGTTVEESVRGRQRLIRRQHQAVGLLVQGMTVTDVARELGVDRSTIHRWLNDSDFRLKLEARREELLTSMLDQQLLASRMATTKLIELLESEDERVALRAAIILYSGGQRIYHFADLKKRIELLENNMQIYYVGKV